MIPTNIHLKITQQPKGFRAFGRWCGDQKQLAKKLAAVLREEPELKEIFAEAVYLSSSDAPLPTVS